MAHKDQWRSGGAARTGRTRIRGFRSPEPGAHSPQPTVTVCPDSFGQVLKMAHPSIQATTRAILPEEGIDIPSQKSPTELERNEGPWLIKDVPGSASNREGTESAGPPCGEVETHSVNGKEWGLGGVII